MGVGEPPVRRAIGVALKDEEDLGYIAPRLDQLIAEAVA